MIALSAYPGGDLIADGLQDLAVQRVSVGSLLVSVGAQRLRSAGLDVPAALADPERRLYDLLTEGGVDSAHGRYNALIRQLISFERAVECAR